MYYFCVSVILTSLEKDRRIAPKLIEVWVPILKLFPYANLQGSSSNGEKDYETVSMHIAFFHKNVASL
jgi:hypothetical protein